MRMVHLIHELRQGALRDALPAIRAVVIHLDRRATATPAACRADHDAPAIANLRRRTDEALELASNASGFDTASDDATLAVRHAARVQLALRELWIRSARRD